MNRHEPGSYEYRLVHREIYKGLVGSIAIAAFLAWSTYYLWDAPRWSKGYFAWWASAIGLVAGVSLFVIGSAVLAKYRQANLRKI